MPTRLQVEQAFHDRQAEQRAADLAVRGFAFSDDEYLDHASWIRPAFARLGDVRGQRLLDLGCGHGMASVVWARRGASVVALDLSVGYLNEARQRARVNGVRIGFVQADGERLPFASQSFDAVWGNAILHHFDVRRAARELHRVLRPGGKAVFCEPWGENPVLRWVRARLPYPEKMRTPDESPLRRADLEALRQVFGRLTVEGHQLLSMVSRLGRTGRWRPALTRWDGAMLRRWPGLLRWCRYVTIEIQATT